MLEIKGKSNTAVVYSDKKDEKSFKQIRQMLDMEQFADAEIRIMPDYHAGAGCVIGFTADHMKNIVPNIIGVDIGCGILAMNLGKEITVDLAMLDRIIREEIPCGFDVHDRPSCTEEVEALITDMYCYERLSNKKRLLASCGTLGGGNHFIELNYSDKSGYWLVIHSGSRNLGKQVASHWQNVAKRNVGGLKDIMNETVKQLPSDERQAFIKAFKKKMAVPAGLEYLGEEDKKKYLHDMQNCQKFAVHNRRMMAEAILRRLDMKPVGTIESIHNYYDFESGIVRKGAISAKKDELCIIPMNMRDGSLICRGKGNLAWNCSAPHGAGRLMSRSMARRMVEMEAYKKSMEGIYSTSVSESTIDECPMAYKPMDEILAHIQDTVEVLETIRPVYNFKASDSDD